LPGKGLFTGLARTSGGGPAWKIMRRGTLWGKAAEGFADQKATTARGLPYLPHDIMKKGLPPQPGREA